MKKPFLFKRGKYYHLQYFDEYEQRKKRISTGESKKNNAIKFLLSFERNQQNKPKLKFISLSKFSKEYGKFIETNLSKAYLIDVNLTFKKLIETIGDTSLNKITTRLLEQFISKEATKTKVQAKKCFANLRSGFNKAIQWEYLSNNPLTYASISKDGKVIRKDFSRESYDDALKIACEILSYMREKNIRV